MFHKKKYMLTELIIIKFIILGEFFLLIMIIKIRKQIKKTSNYRK